jgi:hypothetical protein
VADPQLVAGRGELAAPVAAAVVGEDPLDRDLVPRVEAPRPAEEAGRRLRRLVGQLLDVGEPAVVVDRDVDAVPADALVPARPVAGRRRGFGRPPPGRIRPRFLVSRWTSSPGRSRS